MQHQYEINACVWSTDGVRDALGETSVAVLLSHKTHRDQAGIEPNLRGDRPVNNYLNCGTSCGGAGENEVKKRYALPLLTQKLGMLK